MEQNGGAQSQPEPTGVVLAMCAKLFSALFEGYVTAIFLLVIWPLSRVSSPLKRPRKGTTSYFSDCTPPPRVRSRVRYYSLWTRLVVALCYPARLLAKRLPGSIFNPKTQSFLPTPNQAASLAVMQLAQNTNLCKEAAKQLGARYVFALQPTLMDGEHTLTEYDARFMEARKQTRVAHFSLPDYFARYYTLLHQVLPGCDFLKNRGFLDLSRLFHGQKEQRFIDTVHLGNLGQAEAASRIAEHIKMMETSPETDK